MAPVIARLSSRLSILTLACLACGPAAAPASPQSSASTAPALADGGQTNPTCGGALTPLDGPDPLTATRSEKALPLSLLTADTPKTRFVKSGPLLELGDVQVSDRSHPRAAIDLARLTLKQDVPRAALPAAVASQWDAWFAAISATGSAFGKRLRAKGALDDCPACAAHACIAQALEQAGHDGDAAKSIMTRDRDALATLLDPLAKDPSATPSLLLATAWVLDSRAHADDSQGDVAPALKLPIELYSRAMKAAPIGDPIGLAARYHRAGALEDAGLTLDARSAWREIAEVPSPLRAEAYFRLGSLEDDGPRALSAFASARDADSSPTKIVAVAALISAVAVAEDTNHPRELLDVATRLAIYPDEDAETSGAIARSLDDLGGDIPAAQKAPVTVFAKAALVAADRAEARGDSERAERLRRAVITNDAGSKEADVAAKALSNAKPARSDADSLRARLDALARSCRATGDAAQVDVRATNAGITITAENTGDHDFTACFAARSNWFFARKDPWPTFHARIVF